MTAPSLHGLEVSYFAGEVEAFVPRIVVRPSLGGRFAGQDSHATRLPTDAETFLGTLPESMRDAVAAFCDTMETSGGELQWVHYGPRVRVRGEHGPRVVLNLDADHLWITVGPRKGLSPEPGRRAADRLSAIPGVAVGSDYGRIR